MIFDEQVDREQIAAELESASLQNWTFCNDPYAAAKNAHAILILTEWDTFRTLDYKRLYLNMDQPAFLFDGRNILDLAALGEIGFRTFGIGKGALS
jgi:UDPglucose 6-dehydrogenase